MTSNKKKLIVLSNGNNSTSFLTAAKTPIGYRRVSKDWWERTISADYWSLRGVSMSVYDNVYTNKHGHQDGDLVATGILR